MMEAGFFSGTVTVEQHKDGKDGEIVSVGLNRQFRCSKPPNPLRGESTRTR
jgi:hypothetical protein